MHNSIEIQISVSIDIKKEGNWFIAWCPALDVSSQGRTENEACDNTKEAMQLFLETCFDMGTLNQVLKTKMFHPVLNVDPIL